MDLVTITITVTATITITITITITYVLGPRGPRDQVRRAGAYICLREIVC